MSDVVHGEGLRAAKVCRTVGPRLIQHESIPSPHAPVRPVHVWLPEDYATDTEQYAVLYMHDGQNLFDETRNVFGGSWGLPLNLGELLGRDAVRKTMVVGVFNTPARDQEYMPARVFEGLGPNFQEMLQKECGGAPLSEGYARFLVEDVKPFIDATYRTKPGRDDTFIVGSSMGGLISLDVLLRYPDTFAAAGCLSPHWPLSSDPEVLGAEDDAWRSSVIRAFSAYLGQLLPPAGGHRFWFDHGDQGLDAHYRPYQVAVDRAMAAKGYRPGKDWTTKYFPGADHNEDAWRDRLQEPLAFLLRREGGEDTAECDGAKKSP